MVFQKIKNLEGKSLNVETRNSESWKRNRLIKEYVKVEFKEFKNCEEEVLKFRKRSSQYKIKKKEKWDKKFSKWDSKRSKTQKFKLTMWDKNISKVD